MTDTPPAAKAKKTKAPGEKKARTDKPEGSRLRDWTSGDNGAHVARTFSFDTADNAHRAARRALGRGVKAGKPMDLRLDGQSMTVRLGATGGRVDDATKKLSKGFTPKKKKDANPEGGAA
jgi:hypothetical protein